MLSEAQRIADQLLADQQPDGSWLTMTLQGDDIIWRVDETLYGGVAGIALFLLEAGHRDAALRGLHFCQRIAPTSRAFYTGGLGVAYALLRAFQETRDAYWRDAALRVARACLQLPDDPRRVDDLLGGTAGTLLGLLHVHAATGELEGEARAAAARLAARAHPFRQGVYWDRSPQNVGGLCGFSHGAAGIGFALREAALLLGDDALRRLADDAFAYETARFDPQLENWPDLRSGFYGPQDPEIRRSAYRRGEFALFTTGYDMTAWCHGAVGIGFARLRALELADSPQLRADVAVAVRRASGATVEKAMRAPTLCHGVAGNILLLLSAGAHEEAHRAAEVLLAAREARGHYASGYAKAPHLEDRSLFMGIAGIGYALLRLASASTRPSVLAPSVDVPLQQARFALDQRYSFALLAVEQEVALETASRLAADYVALRNATPRVNPRLQFVGLADTTYVLRPTPMGVAQSVVQPLSAALFESFNGERSVQAVMEELEAEEPVRAQVLELLRAAMLLA